MIDVRHKRMCLNSRERSHLRRIEWKSNSVVEGTMTGIHRSPYHGNAIEFTEHREYVRGDDLRHMDWKVWARTDRYVIKQFEEETNAGVLVMIDGSYGMAYPSVQDPQKFDRAIRLLNGLHAIFDRQHDHFKAAVMDEKNFVCTDILPRQFSFNTELLTPFINWQFTTTIKWNSLPVLIKQRLPRRGFVFIITDGFDSHNNLYRAMSQIKSMGYNLCLFQMLHEDEVYFPFLDSTEFCSFSGSNRLTLNPDDYRERYLETLETDRENLSAICRKAGAQCVLCNSSEPIDAILLRAIAHRPGAVHHRRLG